jgi:hypothetical protein
MTGMATVPMDASRVMDQGLRGPAPERTAGLVRCSPLRS